MQACPLCIIRTKITDDLGIEDSYVEINKIHSSKAQLMDAQRQTVERN